MANNDKHNSAETNRNYSAEAYKHVRVNPITGELDYFYPMRITSPADREFAKAQGLEIARTRLGNRVFDAVMIPCKTVERDATGKESYADTPSEIQHQRYLEFIKAEMVEQDAEKRDGRCIIPDENGGYKRCPLRVANPAYTHGGNEPKTLPVKCEGCKYEEFKHAHTVTPFSTMDYVDEETGEIVPFEPTASRLSFEADRYDRLSEELLEAVRAQAPDLFDFTGLLLREFSRSEAARELGTHTSTAAYRRKKIMEIARKFLDSIIII